MTTTMQTRPVSNRPAVRRPMVASATVHELPGTTTAAARRVGPGQRAVASAAPVRAVVDSPIGPLLLAGDDRTLTHLLLPTGHSGIEGTPRVKGPVADAARQLDQYFAGRRHAFDLPLAPQGTTFQMAVWTTLAEIPYGETISYAELARWVGRPGAARAVGQANGANPIAVILPCHRVVAAGGGLGGYGGGLATKRTLLDLESGRQPLRR